MYRLGQRKKRSKKPIIIGSGIVLLAALVLGGYLFVKQASEEGAQIKNGSATVRYVSAGPSQKSHFDEGLFSFDLPPAWKLVDHEVPPASNYNVYTFQGTTATESSRLVSVYVDQIPTDMAVNHELSVQVQGNGLSHGTVSDNCVNFVSDASRTTPQAVAHEVSSSRWDGVDFLCDLGNYNRNVTGIGAQGAINKVTLAGPKHGAHSYFIVYTDANITPDYTVLYNLLDSFQAQ
jgi:hypothetical protein